MHRTIARYSIDDVAKVLADYAPNTDASNEVDKHAAVAFLLREGDFGVETLFIQRAEHPDDPWSGHMALPGGRVEDYDKSFDAAARRETLEEVGIPVPETDVIARLDDVYGGRLVDYGMAVVPFVCRCDFAGPLKLNYEVADTVWLPLSYLANPENIVEYHFNLSKDLKSFPSYQYEQYTIWGMTYYMIVSLMAHFGVKLPLESSLPTPSDFE